MTASLGFNDTYALGVSCSLAERLKLRRIPDLRSHPEVRLGFSNEFMERADSWPGLRPVAALALLVQGLFELIEPLVVPRGLRLK
jgi:osmoprotectant transport system permease protein